MTDEEILKEIENLKKEIRAIKSLLKKRIIVKYVAPSGLPDDVLYEEIVSLINSSESGYTPTELIKIMKLSKYRLYQILKKALRKKDITKVKLGKNVYYAPKAKIKPTKEPEITEEEIFEL